MSIKLPPLPVPAITMKHGPWKPSQFDSTETYCAHCLTRSIFAHSRRCDPRIDPESLRARDLEVARVVLEGAAKECEKRERVIGELHADQKPRTDAFWMVQGMISASRRNAEHIRKMEVHHHE